MARSLVASDFDGGCDNVLFGGEGREEKPSKGRLPRGAGIGGEEKPNMVVPLLLLLGDDLGGSKRQGRIIIWYLPFITCQFNYVTNQ